MPIEANVTKNPITASVSETKVDVAVGQTSIDVSVAGGVGPTGPAGPTAMASASVLGAVRIGGGVSIDGNGVISVSTAYAAISHSHGFLTSSGTITDNAVSPAFVTAPAVVTTSGFLRQGEFGTTAGTIAQGNHTHDASVLTAGTIASARMPTASANALGAVRIGTGISIDGSGVISASAGFTLPTATGSVLGGVKIGSGVTITDGVISVSTNYAAASHTHVIADVTGLQTALDGKQASGSYAAATHSHSISDVTGLQTALDGKQASGSYAAAVHTHGISDVTGLQTALDGKQAAGSYAAASHSHGNITNAGAIGSTSGQIVVTTTGGVLTTAASISSGAVSGLASIATSGSASDLGSGTVPAARLPAATAGSAGAVIVGSGLNVSSGTISAAVTSVAGRTGAVTIASGDVSGLAASATTDTTNAANISSGMLSASRLTFATTAEAVAGTSTTALLSPARGVDAVLGFGVIDLGWFARVANGGSGAASGRAILMNSNTTANGFYGYSTFGSPGQQFWEQTDQNGIDFSKPKRFIVRIQRGASSTNGVLRVAWGKRSDDTYPGTLARRGIGFEVRNLRFWIICHNGTSLTQVDTGVDYSAVCEMWCESNGSGTVTLYRNGTQIGTTTGGPTAVDNTGQMVMSAEVVNGGDTSQNQWILQRYAFASLR